MGLFDRENMQAVFSYCPSCDRRMMKPAWTANLNVCRNCGYHRPLGGYNRLRTVFDRGSSRELFKKITSRNVLEFPGYDEKIREAMEKTGQNEGCVSAVGKIEGSKAVVCVIDSRFLMGSMGSGLGEKITLSIEYAMNKKLPLIIFSASGGARMQEGIISLMQMAKTSAALAGFDRQGGLFISVLTNPTYGGVTASFASLGDIILAEPGAYIGFAGKRVIENTIGEKLPEGFQTSEFMEEHGFVDKIVPRDEMRHTLGTLLKLHGAK